MRWHEAEMLQRPVLQPSDHIKCERQLLDQVKRADQPGLLEAPLSVAGLLDVYNLH